MASRCRYRLVVRGEVQGVGFRRLAKSIAARMGLSVEAENMPDGSVVIILEGSRGDAERLAKRLAGLRLIRVEEVMVEEAGGP